MKRRLAAAQLGAEVTVVERAGIGGSAVITDVVPSKTLVATADAAVAIRGAGELGVQLFAKTKEGKPLKPEIAINLAAVNKRLLSLARQQSDDMRASLVEAGVRIISGHGRLEGDDAVIVSTGPRGTDFDRIEADTFVVSTGSSPRTAAHRHARWRADPQLDPALRDGRAARAPRSWSAQA